MKRFYINLIPRESIGFGIKIISVFLIALFAITGCGDDNDIIPIEKQPPSIPSEPYPPDGADDLCLDLRISWECSDIDLDTIVYDLYFGNESDPPLFSAQQRIYSYRFLGYDTSSALELDTTYYWKVIAKERVIFKVDSVRVYDEEEEEWVWDYSTDTTWGESSASEIWNFSTSKLYLDTLHMIYNTGSGTIPGNVNKVFVEGENDSLIYIADDNFGLRIVHVVDTSVMISSTDSIFVKTIQPVGTYQGNIREADVKDITVVGNYAYLSGPGVIIIDISDPANPDTTYYDDRGYFDPTTDNDDDIFCASAVSDDENYIFSINSDTISIDSLFNDSLYVIDIGISTAIDSPVVVGRWSSPGTAKDIDCSGDYVYIADADFGLQIVDISDPVNPTFVGNYNYNETDSAMGVFVDGNTAYLAYGKAGLIMVNVADPASPTIIGSPIFLEGEDETGFAKDVYVQDGYAYIAAYWNGGLQIVDIASATVVAKYYTDGGASGVFANSKYVYLADRWPGLLVFEFKH